MSIHPRDITPDLPDPDGASPVGERSRLSKTLCDAINRYYDASEEHSTRGTADEFGLATSTVERHLDATEYRGPCKQHGGVDVYLCTKLRVESDGASVGDLAAEYGLDERTILYHVRGECGHD